MKREIRPHFLKRVFGNWVLWHIPRTGGTNWARTAERAFYPAARGGFPEIHTAPSTMAVEARPEHRYITIIREPLARAVSCAAYSMGYMIAKNGRLPVERFVEFMFDDEILAKAWIARPQAEFLRPVLDQIEFVARTDTLQADFERWFRENFPNLPIYCLGFMNASLREDVPHYYEDPLVEARVREIYADDFRLWRKGLDCLRPKER